MALGAVIKAVKDRWDDESLADTITGGIHQRRGKNLAAPYVVCTTIGNPVALRASRGEGTATRYERPQIQLLLIDNAGPQAARTKADIIKAAFDNAPLTLDAGTLLFCRFVTEIDLDDPEDPGNPNAVLWAQTYEVLTAESETLSPS